jgi:hypothetical protein
VRCGGYDYGAAELRLVGVEWGGRSGVRWRKIRGAVPEVPACVTGGPNVLGLLFCKSERPN